MQEYECFSAFERYKSGIVQIIPLGEEMKRLTVIIILLSVLLAVSNIAWAIYHNFQLQQIKPKGWKNVLTWWGTERNNKSKTFDAAGVVWWILWAFNGKTEGARCDITVYDSHTNNTLKSISLTNYGDEEFLNLIGRFYLTLNVQGDIVN